jgi:hypothetical protein
MTPSHRRRIVHTRGALGNVHIITRPEITDPRAAFGICAAVRVFETRHTRPTLAIAGNTTLLRARFCVVGDNQPVAGQCAHERRVTLTRDLRGNTLTRGGALITDRIIHAAGTRSARSIVQHTFVRRRAGVEAARQRRCATFVRGVTIAKAVGALGNWRVHARAI